MSQLVQKLPTTIPEVKQTNFALTQLIISKNLKEDAYNNQECQNSETNSEVMCDNSNIDQTTNQKIYFSQDIFYEVKLLKLLNKIGAPSYSYKKIMEWAREAYLADYKLTAHMHLIMQH